MAPNFDGCFQYCGSIEHLNFLEKNSHPAIAYANNKCARLSEDPRTTHGAAVENLVKYPAATKNNGLVIDPQNTQSSEVYADSDFGKN